MAKNYEMDQVLAAIATSAGVMSYVAVKLGCGWEAARKYVNKWPETKEAFQEATSKLDAVAYKSFIKAIEAGERWAVERVLDTSARRDGHGMTDHAKISGNIEHQHQVGVLMVPIASTVNEWEVAAADSQKRLMDDATDI